MSLLPPFLLRSLLSLCFVCLTLHCLILLYIVISLLMLLFFGVSLNFSIILLVVLSYSPLSHYLTPLSLVFPWCSFRYAISLKLWVIHSLDEKEKMNKRINKLKGKGVMNQRRNKLKEKKGLINKGRNKLKRKN